MDSPRLGCFSDIWYCPFCPAGLDTEDELRDHIEECHPDDFNTHRL